MEKYEVTYLTSQANKVESVEKSIKELDGSVIDSIDLGIKELAYPVNKLTEARFVSVIFNISPANLNNLDKKLFQDESIIRFILIKALRAKKIVKERRFKKDKPVITVEKSPTKAEPEIQPAPKEEPKEEKQEKVIVEPVAIEKPAKIKIKVEKAPEVEIKKPKVKSDKESLSSDELDKKLKELVED